MTGRDNYVHRYAVIVSKPVGIFGLRANLNVWNPKTATTDMSLAQTWIVIFTSVDQGRLIQFARSLLHQVERASLNSCKGVKT
jgi:hypothetical protein